MTAVNQLAKDGSSPLSLIKTEGLLLSALKQIAFEEIQNVNMIQLFQQICSRDFKGVLAQAISHYSDKHANYFELMLSQNEGDGNNALMKAAISKSEGVLMSLLGFVSSSNQAETHLDQILHLKNAENQTVLKILISQGQDFQFYQVITKKSMAKISFF